MNLVKRSIVILLLLPFSASSQQHFRSNQYMHNLGPVNPSWYLLDLSNSLNATVRKQWAGIEGAPSTLILNGHVPLNTFQAAMGFNFSYDTFGPEKLFNVNTFFAKSVRLSKGENYLSAFLSVGLSSYEAFYSRLDSSDPTFRDDILETMGTLGLGVMYYIPEKFFAGFSVPHLSMRELGIASKTQDYDFDATYYMMAGYLGRVNEVFKIKPVVLASQSKGQSASIDISTTLYIQDALGLGVNYGTTRELGAQLSFHVNNYLRFGYSYQFGTESYGISNLRNNTHEVGVSFRFGKSVKRKLL